MSSIVSRARGLAATYAPRDTEFEEAVWFAATVLHDIWLLPEAREEKA